MGDRHSPLSGVNREDQLTSRNGRAFKSWIEVQTGKRSESANGFKSRRDSYSKCSHKKDLARNFLIWMNDFFLDSDWFLDDTTVESGGRMPNQIVKVNPLLLAVLVSRQSISRGPERCQKPIESFRNSQSSGRHRLSI